MHQPTTGGFKTHCMDCLKSFWGTETLAVKKGYDCLYGAIGSYVNRCFNNLQSDQKSDVVHNALLKIHQAGAETVVETCSAWVRTIAHREGINLLRKETRHTKDRADEDSLAYDSSERASETDDFSAQLEWQENIEKIIAFLQEESGGEDDLVIITGLVNGESYEEIGQKIGRAKGAVATRASVIRKKLQSLRKDFL